MQKSHAQKKFHTQTFRLKSRGCYFLRNVPAEKPIKVDIGSDSDLLFGEISAQPLDSLNTSLSEIFLPMLQKANGMNPYENSGYQTNQQQVVPDKKVILETFGQCDTEQRMEFQSGLIKFTGELQDAIKSLTGGIELRKLGEEYFCVDFFWGVVFESTDINDGMSFSQCVSDKDLNLKFLS